MRTISELKNQTRLIVEAIILGPLKRRPTRLDSLIYAPTIKEISLILQTLSRPTRR